jgi:hypothetical protein
MQHREFIRLFAKSGLGLTPVQALERDRYLRQDERVRGEGLRPVHGTAPGKGPPATLTSCTLEMLASLAGSPYGGSAEAAWALWHFITEDTILDPDAARIADCGLTRQALFGDAVRCILGSPDLAARVRAVSVVRDLKLAIIAYRGTDDVSRESRFRPQHEPREDEKEPRFGVMASVPGAVLRKIAEALGNGE